VVCAFRTHERSSGYKKGRVRPIGQDVERIVHAWLFVRGEESIRISSPTSATLLACGPGIAKRAYNFDNPASMQEFLQSYQERLLSEGWVLAALAERRESERDIPVGHAGRAQEKRSKPPRQAR